MKLKDMLKKLKKQLESTGMPVAYRRFPNKKIPKLPFIVYWLTSKHHIYADGKPIETIAEIIIELHCSSKNLEAEGKIEEALSDYGWTSAEYEDEDDGELYIVYEMEEFIDEQ